MPTTTIYMSFLYPRAGLADKETAKQFYVAGNILDVMQQFGELVHLSFYSINIHSYSPPRSSIHACADFTHHRRMKRLQKGRNMRSLRLQTL